MKKTIRRSLIFVAVFLFSLALGNKLFNINASEFENYQESKLTPLGNGGTTDFSIDYVLYPDIPNDPLPIESEPTIIGYDAGDSFALEVLDDRASSLFMGWYETADYTGDEVIEITPAMTGDLTLYAKWELKEFTVTFIHEGVIVDTIPVLYGEQIETMPSVQNELDGKTFHSWRDEFDNEFKSEHPVIADLTVYSFYVEMINIEYVLYPDIPNDPIVFNGETSFVKGEAFLLETPEDRVSSIFVGWYDNADYTGDPITVLPSSLENDITLYAKWELRDVTVTFMHEGAVVTTIALKYGEVIETMPTVQNELDGKTFHSWRDEFDNEFKSEHAVIVDLTVYSFYVEMYNIEYVLYPDIPNDPIDFETEHHTYYKHSLITLDIPVDRVSSTFSGWYLDANYTGDAVTQITPDMTGDLVFYAKWELREYTVTFMHEGLEHHQLVVKHGHVVDNIPAEPEVIPGKMFIGWRDILDNELKEETPIIGDITYYSFYAIVYEVEFEVDGQIVDTVIVIKDDKVERPAEDPTKVGHTFVDWYVGQDLYDFDSKVTEDLVIVAKFEINTFTVTFVDYDDTVIDTQIVDYGSDAVAPADPTRVGYTFKEWDVDFTNVTADLTVKAVYDINEYTVTFVDHDDTILDTQTVEYGSDAVAPADPTRTGYTFKEWDTDYTNVTADLTVKAVYDINTYELTWVVDGVDTVVEYDFGETIVVLADPVKEGYTFTSWTPEAPATMPAEHLTITAQFTVNTYELTWVVDGVDTVVEYDFGETIVVLADPVKVGYTFTGWDVVIPATMPANNLTITAEFEINKYTVTFVDYDDTVLDTQTVEYGNDAVAPVDPTRVGYTFKEWDTDYTNVTADLTVKAVYDINKYTVTFVDHDDTVIDTQTVEYGSDAVAPADPTRVGYTFKEWDVDFTNVTADLTVKAVYEINKYTVTFVDHDDTVLSTQEIEHGNDAVAPADPTRTGYTFKEWDVDFTNVTADLTVKAVYEINKYTVTFVDHDDSVLVIQTVEYGSDAVAPAEPTRVGYTFKEWDTDYTNVTADLTVKAVYEINKYTVSFDTDGGSDVDAQLVEHGSEAIKPNDPTKAGYEFMGWYIGEVEYDFTTLVTEDLTIVAKWNYAVQDAKDSLRDALEEYIKDVEEPNDYLYDLIDDLVDEVDETNYDNLQDLIDSGKQQLLELEQDKAIEEVKEDYDTSSDRVKEVIDQLVDEIEDADINDVKDILDEAEERIELAKKFDEVEDVYNELLEDSDLYSQENLDLLNSIYQDALDKYEDGLITKEQLDDVIEEMRNVPTSFATNTIRPGNDRDAKRDEAYGYATSKKGFKGKVTVVVEVALEITNQEKIQDLINEKKLIHKNGDLSADDLHELLDGKELYGQLDIYLVDEQGNRLTNEDLANADEITVNILLPRNLSGREGTKVLYLSEDKVEVFDVTDEDKWLTFTTDHFSNFYLIGDEEIISLWWVIIVLLVVIAVILGLIIHDVKFIRRKRALRANSVALPVILLSLAPTSALIIIIALAVVIFIELAYLIYLQFKKYEKEVVVEKEVIVEKEIIVEKPVEVIVEKEVVVEKPVEVVPVVVPEPEPEPVTEVRTIYNYSFKSRLHLADEETEERYNEIKNHLLSYKGVSANMSWKQETFTARGKMVVKLRLQGKTMRVYLGVDPKAYEDTKYNIDDVSNVKTHETTPSLLVVKGPGILRHAMELIDDWMKEHEVELDPEYKEKNFAERPLQRPRLIELGLVKVSEATFIKK